MFVKYDKENSKVLRGPQLVRGSGDGWLPFLEGESFVINSETQTASYVLSDDETCVCVRVEGDADLTWKQQRVEAYGILADQLDMLWHDINNDTLDNTGAFFTYLKNVKDTYPKG